MTTDAKKITTEKNPAPHPFRGLEAKTKEATAKIGAVIAKLVDTRSSTENPPTRVKRTYPGKNKQAAA